MFQVCPVLLINLLAYEYLLLGLHLLMNVLHLHILPQPLVILIPLLIALKLERLKLADSVLIVVIDLSIGLGLVHDLVQRLGEDDLLQMLLVDPLLSSLGLSDLVQVVLLPGEDCASLGRPLGHAHAGSLGEDAPRASCKGGAVELVVTSQTISSWIFT
jgi:hypothetical protein